MMSPYPLRALPALAQAVGLLLAGFVAVNAAAADEKTLPEPKTDTKAEPAKPDTSALKPFADIIKGASQSDGYFPVWTKDDKVWLEIPADRLDVPFFFEVNRSNGIGERGVYGSQMEDAYIASFRRLGDRIQLLAHNTRFYAEPGTPQADSVAQGFSNSLISSATVLSRPHPERKSILIDANALLLADIPYASYLLESAFRLPYAFDAKQSAILKTRADKDITALQVSAHYSVARIPPPPLVPPGSAPPPQTPPPFNLEDPRSLFLGFHYSLARLPEPMAARHADDRLGHFATTRWNFGSDLNAVPREYLVNRWRLEKADPQAALSEPKQPIVYWLDKNIPEQHRAAVRDGVLAWNQAFERIGFKNAIVVKQQGRDDDFDTLEARRPSIRWFVGSDVGFAIGPSKVDPRSGEILDADIALSDVFARGSRTFFREDRPETPRAFFDKHGNALCNYASAAAADMSFGLDLLEARGEIEPGSPEEAKYVYDVLRDVTMHEVGHTLGLRHNFRASTIYSEAQLADKQFTASHGIAGSVMDYTPVNVALKGQPQGEYRMVTLGDYDYWAIEYAYKPLPAAEEQAELAKIIARSTERNLTYSTDEDAGNGEDGFDPDASRFDLGNDPLAYFDKRMKLARELWGRLQNHPLAVGASHAAQRRTIERSFAQINRAIDVSAKYIGGVSYLRDHAGTGRAPLTLIDAAIQRRALKLLAENIFAPDSFRFAPDFLRQLTPDGLDRYETGQRVEVNINDRILAMQRQVLGRLYRDTVADRILDYPNKAVAGSTAFTLSELYDTLQKSIWQELATGREPDVTRRSLQREHLRQLVRTLTRPAPSTPADAVSLSRENARELIAALKKAAAKPKLSRETLAHYNDAQETLQEALKAGYWRG